MSSISGTENVLFSSPRPAALCRTYSKRSSSRFASGRSRTPRTTLKIAAFAPMPRARVAAAMIHNVRARAKERIASLRSRSNDMIVVLGASARLAHRLEQARLERLQRRARAIAHAELGEHAGDVILDGALRRAESVGDLLVAIAARHQADDLDLALGQALDRRLGRAVQAIAVPVAVGDAQQPVGHRRLKDCGAGGAGADRRDQLVIGDVLEHEAAGAGAGAVQHHSHGVER